VNSRITKAMVRESHKKQFNGTDYQQAAWEIAQGLKFKPTDDEWQELMSGPDEGCECGFCKTAKWEDS
jgi:hypothetical protein